MKIAVCSFHEHGGSTHHAIALTLFLQNMGYKTCYSERQSGKCILTATETFDTKMVRKSKNYKYNNKYTFYPKEVDMSEIEKDNYDFIICDYGCCDFLPKSVLGSSDLVIAACNSAPWELNCLCQKCKEGFENSYIIINFTAEKQRNDILKQLPISNVYFAEYEPVLFGGSENNELYEQIAKNLFVSEEK